MVAPTDPEGSGLFELPGRTQLRISGSDRVRFLNGQITNSITKATDSSAIAACILNAKGRLQAHVFVSAAQDSYVLDADPQLRETLPLRLERYIVADDVEIEDVSNQFVIFHLLSTTIPDLKGDYRVVSVKRFRKTGFDLVVKAARRDEIFENLSAHLRFCDATCSEIFRIEQGIPRWGMELTDEIIPVEANLEESCVDYEKGCYIGQETISRMKMSGQKNKQLCGLFAPAQTTILAPGMRLFPANASSTSKDVGWITSAAKSYWLGMAIALGYVKRGFNSVGTELDARADSTGAAGTRLRITDLPFSPEKSAK